MRVGITMRTIVSPFGELHDAIARSWFPLLKQFGVVPVLIPNGLDDVVGFAGLMGIERLLLTGGDDVGKASPTEVSVAPRDMTEEALICWAVDNAKPVLGVCRGLQMLNVYFGGHIVRELSKVVPEEKHKGQAHSVRLANGTVLNVNSYHEQGVLASQVAPGLSVVAVSAGGVVEAIAHPSLNIRALQWHPERALELNSLDRAVINEWLK